MTAYIALIRKSVDSDYGVDFPDLPGCVTAGRTLDEARVMAAEAASLHIEGLIEDEATIPAPTGLDAIMADAENQRAIAFLVDVRAVPSQSVRIDVTLPEELVERIDRLTPNRSDFLAEAARTKLGSA